MTTQDKTPQVRLVHQTVSIKHPEWWILLCRWWLWLWCGSDVAEHKQAFRHKIWDIRSLIYTWWTGESHACTFLCRRSCTVRSCAVRSIDHNVPWLVTHNRLLVMEYAMTKNWGVAWSLRWPQEWNWNTANPSIHPWQIHIINKPDRHEGFKSSTTYWDRHVKLLPPLHSTFKPTRPNNLSVLKHSTSSLPSS